MKSLPPKSLQSSVGRGPDKKPNRYTVYKRVRGVGEGQGKRGSFIRLGRDS